MRITNLSRSVGLLLVSLSCLPLSVQAAPRVFAESLSSVFSPGLLAVINESSFGVGLLHQNYREFNNGLSANIGEILDREDGNIAQLRYHTGGLYGAYLVHVTLDYAYGNTRYDGHLLSSGAPASATTRNNIADIHFNVGYALFTGPHGVLAPEVELGYRTWRRHIIESGQEETYGHTYLGLGLHGYYQLSPRTVIDLRYVRGQTINPSIQGTDTIYFGNSTLGSKPYTHAELGVDYRWGEVWHVGLRADYMAWRYGHSSNFVAVSGTKAFLALEPDSKTSQTSYLLTFGRTW